MYFRYLNCAHTSMAFSMSSTLLVVCLASLARADDFQGKELQFPEPGSAEESSPPYATVAGLTMPEFKDATLCFRLKTSVSSGRVSIFSYAVGTSDNEFSAEINLNKNVLFFFKNDEEFGIDLSKSDFKNKQWSQMCVVWDNTKSQPSVLVGNFETGSVQAQAATEFNGHPEDGSVVKGGGSVVIGQDQDQVMGGFTAQDGMKGRIGNVQLFSRMLSQAEVGDQMKCSSPEGDLLAWSNAGFSVKNGLTLVDASAPCKK